LNVGCFSISDSFPKTSLRAFQPGQQAMLCHCFDISESAYRTALDDGRAKSIKALVVQHYKLLNAQGNFTQLIDINDSCQVLLFTLDDRPPGACLQSKAAIIIV